MGGVRTSGVELLEGRRLMAAVLGVTLVNPDSGAVAAPLPDGATVDLHATGRRVAVRASLDAAAGSVRFNLDGDPAAAVVNAAAAVAVTTPPMVPAVGHHTLVVTPYSGANGTGTRGTPEVLRFDVIDTGIVPAAVRVNAGGKAYTDKAGEPFTVDKGYFQGGLTTTTTAIIAGTADQAIYQTSRYGRSFSFVASVSPGTYRLTLLTADPTATKAGQDVYTVTANGTPLAKGFDPVAVAGKARTAIVQTETVSAVSGRVTVAFASTKGNAYVSGVELAPADRVSTVPSAVRVDAGGPALLDDLGRPFGGDSGFTGGTVGIDAAVPDGTADAALFGTDRSGPAFTFARPVANGNYELFLEFADPTATAAGQRTFDVTVEGWAALTDFDVVAAATSGPLAAADGVQYAAGTPVAVAVPVTVSDGTLNVAFAGVVGEAFVSALALVPTDLPAAAAPYAAGSAAGRQVTAEADLHQIGLGLFYDAQDHRGRYAPDLATMFAEEGLAATNLADPRAADAPTPRDELSGIEQQAWVNTLSDYLYTAGDQREADVPATAVVAYENPAKVGNDPLAVLYGDGSAGLLSRAALAAAVPGSVPAVTPRVPIVPTPPAADQAVLASQSNLTALSDALLEYEADHQQRLPPDLGTLASGYGPSAGTFLDPREHAAATAPAGLTEDALAAWVNAHTDYVLATPGGRANGPADQVLAYEVPSALAGGVDFLFADGHVEFRESAWAADTIARAGR